MQIFLKDRQENQGQKLAKDNQIYQKMFLEGKLFIYFLYILLVYIYSFHISLAAVG